MSYEFVEAPAEDRAEIAGYLVALAREHGISLREIRKAARNGKIGYLVPSALLDVEKPDTEIIMFTKVDKVEDGSNVVVREPDIERREDGGLYVKEEAAERILAAPRVEVDREVVRQWLKENGYEPAESGALKKAHLTAYYEQNEA